MPLPDDLRAVALRYECPKCDHPIIRRGSWFRAVSTFKCEECGTTLRLGYGQKLALFQKHMHLRANQSS
ncbi:hypothetical protein EN813_010010 [Mesorhizobium sp. M00.F.Ca.ET.170.01.1.1]|nr:hypothetical protein EN813_010010 [Mesorhizobium sp. M00.F.Ca.ET.170.01.1.1]